MALVAGSIIEEARDHHPTFDEQTHPQKICLRALSSWQKVALQQGLIRYPDLFDDGPTTIDLPLDDFDAGYALEQAYNVLDAEVRGPNDMRAPVVLIDPSARFDPRPEWAAWIRGGTLYLSGRAQDWQPATSIVLRWASTPVDLAALADELVLPESARLAAVMAVARFMAGRQIARGDFEKPSVAQFEAQATEALTAWLEGLWLLSSANVSTIREVC